MSIANMRIRIHNTQLELARKIGVDRSTIAKWETGKSMPRAEMLPKLAECLGCTVDELLKKEVRSEEK